MLRLPFFFVCFFFVFVFGSTLMPLKEAELLRGGPALCWRALSGAGPLLRLPLAASFWPVFSDLLTLMERPPSLLPSSLRASWTASAL